MSVGKPNMNRSGKSANEEGSYPSGNRNIIPEIDPANVEISLNPDDSESTNLIQQFVGLVTEAECTWWDYFGNGSVLTPAIHLVVECDDAELGTQDVWWSAGSAKRLQPNPDKSRFVRSKGSSATGLSKTCNAQRGINSCVEHNFPRPQIQKDVRILKGMHAGFIRVDQIGREGLDDQAGEEGGESGKWKKTTMIVDFIDKFPWQQQIQPRTAVPPPPPQPPAAAKPNGKANGSPQPQLVPEPIAQEVQIDSGALSTEATKIVFELLRKAEGKKIEINRIGNLAFRACKNDNLRYHLLDYVVRDEFLRQPDAPWRVEGGLIILE